MGLDMYLNKMPKIEGLDFKALMDMEGRLKSIVEEAGEEYSKIQKSIKKTEYGWPTMDEEMGYWRKANQIHNWFVQNVQDGKDECEPNLVTKDDVDKLLEICKLVKEDHDLADQLLPTTEGFFFGGTKYDEYYFADIDDTIRILNELKDFDYENNYLYYVSSW